MSVEEGGTWVCLRDSIKLFVDDELVLTLRVFGLSSSSPKSSSSRHSTPRRTHTRAPRGICRRPTHGAVLSIVSPTALPPLSSRPFVLAIRRPPADPSHPPRLGQGRAHARPPILDALVAAVRNLRTLRTLAVPKAAGSYLSSPLRARCRMLLLTWSHNNPHLPSFRRPSAHASRFRPLLRALQTLRTPLPAASSLAYLTVAANPALTRVFGRRQSGAFALVLPFYSLTSVTHCPTVALFLHAARPHTWFTELIKAGTDICVGGWRGRAATVGAQAVNAYAYGAGSGRGGAC
ncbi:hypothetical protein C8R47DRAFT_1260646 [Mycena vitilis]|nr:hypothetical protein C8R47DRAFT_1260646 [Mycena vitilis]